MTSDASAGSSSSIFKMTTTRNLLPRLQPGALPASPTVDLSPAAFNDSPFKRRCISTACMPCRKRKSKCDGVKPSCFACQTTYSSPCYYDIDSDHRRKGALKRDIQQLKGELNAQTVILEALKRANDADVDDIINLIRANPDESYESIADNIQKLSLGTRQKQESSGGVYGLEGELANLSAQSASDKTGDLRQYGHTSSLYYSQIDGEQPLGVGDQMGSWTTVTNDVELINHLLDLYFTWSHPFYLIFSEEIFYHGLQDKKLKYCTPLLVNAILALGCVYSNRTEAKADPKDPSSRGAHFFAEAKRLLEADDRSSLTTVQALGVMSIRQAKSDYDSPGWQYASQMMSMSSQMGLHMESAAEPNMTASEVEARRVTFWGVFSLHTCWSVCLGRLPSLPRTAIRLQKPKPMQNMKDRPWKPHGLPSWDGIRENLILPSHKYLLLLQISFLSEILNDVLYMFYAPRDRITSRKLQYYHEKLQTWFKNLPETLHINKTGPTTPQVYALHMYYHTCIINLFRPFLKVSFIQGDKTPRQICTEKANTISRLMDQYIGTYDTNPTVFVQSHGAMSAGIIHLVDISSTLTTTSIATREQSEIFLAASIRQLYSMSLTYPLVKRFLQAIVGLTHKWCTIIPKRVDDAIVESTIQLSSIKTISVATNPYPKPALITDTNNFTNPPTRNNTTNYLQFSKRKHSAPDSVGMAPPHPQTSNHSQNSTSNIPFSSSNPNLEPQSRQNQSFHHPQPSHPNAPPQYQQHLYWTPFPDSLDGVPLPMPHAANGNYSPSNEMSVTSMLDGEYPHLSQDGFMLVNGDDGLREEEVSPFWEGWEGRG